MAIEPHPYPIPKDIGCIVLVVNDERVRERVVAGGDDAQNERCSEKGGTMSSVAVGEHDGGRKGTREQTELRVNCLRYYIFGGQCGS